MIMKKNGLNLLLISLIAINHGCCPAKQDMNPVTQTWPVMGTFSSVSVPESDKEKLPEYAEAVKEVFDGLNGSMSVYKPDSEISRLNRAAGLEPIAVSAPVADVLALSLKYGDISQGCFDITVAPLVRLWGFNGGVIPQEMLSMAVISEALNMVGYRHLTVSDGLAKLDKPGMMVDLGGIAKGYAVDVAYDKLIEKGCRSMMVNLGGNMRCRGTARPDKPWTVGVRNPFDKDRIIGVITLPDGMAVATSGNYERFVTIKGKQYAHIIDPRTGHPVEGMAGVTVISKSGVETDAMSTSLFVAGLHDAKALLAAVPECQALLIEDKQPLKIWISEGFKKYFQANPELVDSVRILQ